MVETLQWQREYVTAAGSPVAALVLQSVIDDLEAGGGLGDMLPESTRFGDLLGLRVMAAVHRLALDRRAPGVALHLPTLGGRGPAGPAGEARFRRTVVEALLGNREELGAYLGRTPQTNETGRAALLRIALAQEDPLRPVHLRELGASGGLNLRADHLPGLQGAEAGPLPSVVDRLGCDVDPVDVSTEEGRSLLSSYIWVDDVERFDRLRHALKVAVAVPATVVRADAADFAATVRPRDGVTTVVWHSAMWVYLPQDTRRSAYAAIRGAGAMATASAPLSHVSWEWHGTTEGHDAFSLVRRRWNGGPDDGRPCLLATGLSHGRDVRVIHGAPWLRTDPLITWAA